MVNRRFDLKKISLLSISITILIFMIYEIGPSSILDSLLSIELIYLMIAFSLLLLSTLARVVRWYSLFQYLNFKDSSKIYLVTPLINLLAPAGTGELGRAYIAKVHYHVDFGKALAATLVEKLIDTTILLVLATMSVVLFLQGTAYIFILFVPFLILLVGYLILLRPSILKSFAHFILRFENKKIVGEVVKKGSKTLRSFENALLSFRNKKTTIIVATSLTIFSIIFAAFSQMMVIIAFGYLVNPLYMVIIFSASLLIGFFTFLPGGLGTRELVSIVLLQAVGVPLVVAASSSFIFRVLIYIRSGILGIWGIASLPKSK